MYTLLRNAFSHSNYRLIECEELHSLLSSGNKTNLKVLHAYRPENRANNMAETVNFITQGHIPGAYFVSINYLQDLSSKFGDTVPSDEQFIQFMKWSDFSKEDGIVIYSDSPTISSRVHWLFDVFGHTNLYFLNGGFKRWQNLNLQVEKGLGKFSSTISSRPDSHFDYKMDRTKYIDF